MSVVKIGMLASMAAIAFGSACGQVDEKQLNFVNHPIIGGQPVAEGQYPEVVLVITSSGQGSQSCTGTVISRRVVLTAGHCVEGNGVEPGDIHVGFGESHFGYEPRGVVDFLQHPGYDESPDNDLALLRLDRDPPANVLPMPVLPEVLEITDADIGAELLFVGFGMTSAVDEGGTKLWMTTQLDNICTRPAGCWPGRTNTICIEQGQTGICSGDSGGPAFMDRDGVRYVAGVNSYTFGNCDLYGCAVKVDAYQDWIDEFVGELTGSACALDVDCASARCSDGVCCETDCDGLCQRCNLSGQEGVCVTLPDDSVCSDGNHCNGEELCLGGVCESGEAIACDDGIDCTVDVCDADLGCVSTVDRYGCWDENDCTQDYCDAETGCSWQPVADGTVCDKIGKCRAGECVLPGEKSGCNCGSEFSAGWALVFFLGLLGALFFRVRK